MSSQLLELGFTTGSNTTKGTTTLITELKQCGKRKDLERGKHLHNEATKTGYQKNIRVASTLISMYSKCGDMLLARGVFDTMTERDTVVWTALIVGYVDNGESLVALDLFNCMDCAPNHFTFAAVLKACTGLAKVDKKACLYKGTVVHRLAQAFGFDKDVVVANTLLDMYSKGGEIKQARRLFDRMTEKTVFSWNILILGYVESGESSSALEVFHRMDCEPNAVTFLAALKTCTGLKVGSNSDKGFCLENGLRIHQLATELDLDKDALVASTLTDMYCKCGEMVVARRVFDEMTNQTVVSWNVLILGYVDTGQSMIALDLFKSMDSR